MKVGHDQHKIYLQIVWETDFLHNMDQVEILSEDVIKVEDVKQEPDDQPEEETCNFEEGGRLCPVKRELLEEDDEEELKPPIRVFLNPAEEASGEVNREDKDPLALDNEFFLGASEVSAGGAYDAEDTVMDDESGVCREGNELTHVGAGRMPNEDRADKKTSAKNASRFPEPNSTRSENERSLCAATHGDSPAAYQCSVCHKSCRWRSQLVTHMRIHSGERPYECSVCQKSFGQRCNLERHMRIHSGEGSPYECPVCQRKFSKTSSLDTHMHLHSSEAVYNCSICQKRFTSKSYLESHMLLHNVEHYFLFSTR